MMSDFPHADLYEYMDILDVLREYLEAPYPAGNLIGIERFSPLGWELFLTCYACTAMGILDWLSRISP